MEKVDKPPEIQKLGKRWQPPPEKSYIWPHLQKPVTIQTDNLGEMSEQTINGEYRWTPAVRQPDFKREQKNFTLTHSPPDSPRRRTGQYILWKQNTINLPKYTKNFSLSQKMTKLFKFFRIFFISLHL